MISCGEPSGDLYAASLTTALREREPDIEVFGFGGRRLEAAGGRLVGDFAGVSVTGLTEALRVIPRSYAMLRRLVDAARTRRPDVFVAVDFPDFNFRLMSAVHALGIPVVYYISPQLWAWRPGRMAQMQQHVARVLVIFPFETALYQEAGVPVEFVGHPLVDLARRTQSRDSFLSALGLTPAAPTVALLPGSRPNEVRRTIPTIAAALPLIRARVPDAQFVVAGAPELQRETFDPLLAAVKGVVLAENRTDDVLEACDVVITASGTATVQCTLHERPMVVVYRLSTFTYQLAKRLVRVPHIAMPNLVAGRRIVPELVQEDFTPERVAREVVALLTDRASYERTCRQLRDVRERLGGSGASGRAADAVLAEARRRQERQV
ncbi:MAG TPA: lipid-A-disaccharide synthase [Vicinamibacterales bacterium]|nr:lipid-A-disaccharide synthase [Vicinamibacterales bacterium]